MPGGIKALFGTLPIAGIIFAYFGFEQANQLAGEIKNPQRNVPRAIIISVLVAAGIYCLVQVTFIGAMPAARSARASPASPTPTSCPQRSPAWPASSGSAAGWRSSCGSMASSRRPARA